MSTSSACITVIDAAALTRVLGSAASCDASGWEDANINDSAMPIITHFNDLLTLGHKPLYGLTAGGGVDLIDDQVLRQNSAPNCDILAGAINADIAVAWGDALC
jgi:hypothetical protein